MTTDVRTPLHSGPPGSSGATRALALRLSMSSNGPAPERLRVAAWNLNSLRARLAALERFLDRVHPDVRLVGEGRRSFFASFTEP